MVLTVTPLSWAWVGGAADDKRRVTSRRQNTALRHFKFNGQSHLTARTVGDCLREEPGVGELADPKEPKCEQHCDEHD